MMAFIEQEANEKAEEIDAKVMKLKIKRNKMMIKKINFKKTTIYPEWKYQTDATFESLL